MNKERILTTLKYFPIVILAIELNIPILVDIVIALVAIRAIYEYTNCAKEKNYHIVSWIGYAIAILLAFRSLIETKRRVYNLSNFISYNYSVFSCNCYKWKNNF